MATGESGRPIRLLMHISDLRGGGAEREFISLARHLSRERFEPQLCFWRPIFTHEAPGDLPVHMLRKTRPWHVMGVIRELRVLIERLRPHLVFSQLHYVNMVTGSALARARHRPGWVCRQVNDPRREMRGPFLPWARRSLARADRVLGCCEGVSRAMIDHLRLAPERVGTMFNAVDAERIERLAAEPLPVERRPDHFTVVHAGRLTRQKNQALLLQAFARMRGRPAELWMLGEGELEGRLRRLARRLDIEDRVRWLGFQSNPYPFYRQADCLGLSSDHEGLPNVLIESMICGTPAVSTRCPYGPDELIEHGVTGLLTPVGDAEALAVALGQLADGPARSRQMGQEARRRARLRFDTVTTCAAYEQLFESLVTSSSDARSPGADS